MIIDKKVAASSAATPKTGSTTIFVDLDNKLKLKQDNQQISTIASGDIPAFQYVDNYPQITINNAIYPVPTATRLIQNGAGEQEILEAQEWLKARVQYGAITFDYNANITLTDSITLDMQRITQINGNRSRIRVDMQDPDKGVYLDNLNTLGTSARFQGPSYIDNINWIGTNVSGNKNTSAGIVINGTQPGYSPRISFRGGSIQGFNIGHTLGDQSYFVQFYDYEFFRNGDAGLAKALALDAGENPNYNNCKFYNNRCHYRTESGMKIRFNVGCSFDFHGGTDADVLPQDRIFNIGGGASLTLIDPHIEWRYGQYSGQTNSPVLMRGANSRLYLPAGGRLYYERTNNIDPLYESFVDTNNSSQLLLIHNAETFNMGMRGRTKRDVWLTGTGQTDIKNVRSYGALTTDVVGLGSLVSSIYQGTVDSFVELDNRSAKIGSITLSKVTGTAGIPAENGVIPAFNQNNMSKMVASGAGKLLITIPNTALDYQHGWHIWINTANITSGSFTIREKYITGVGVFNGTDIEFKTDTRYALPEAYAPGIVNVPSAGLEIGVNEWRRISWKDTRQSTLRDRKNSSDITVVEIETSAALVGALYISGFGIGPL